MHSSRKPGAGLTGACSSLAGDAHACIRPVPQPQVLDLRNPAVRRLHSSPRLQRAFEHLQECGARPVAEFCVELIDASGGDPAQLDRVLVWQRLDAGIVAAIGCDQFLSPPLRLVPPR